MTRRVTRRPETQNLPVGDEGPGAALAGRHWQAGAAEIISDHHDDLKEPGSDPAPHCELRRELVLEAHVP
jgi:hypothetical protein